MKYVQVAFALTTAAAMLSGCAKTDFSNDEEKIEAFSRYQCKVATDNDLQIGSYVGNEILKDKSRPIDEKTKAMDLMVVPAQTVDAEWDYYLSQNPADFEPSPHYRADPRGDGDCFGWTWEKYLELKTNDTNLDGFTYQQAKDSGVL